MCGRIPKPKGYHEVAKEMPKTRQLVANFERIAAAMPSSYNAAPGTDQCVIVETRDGELMPRAMRWGLIRPWSKPDSPQPSNARAETILQKPMFSDLLASKRCLVPSNGYYEWKKEGTKSIPYYIHDPERNLIMMAAIYDAWRDGDTIIESHTLITTTPAESIAHIHGRMPVIIEPENFGLWLSRSERDLNLILPLLRPYPSERLAFWQISNRINDVRNDDADLLAPVTGERQAALAGMWSNDYDH